MSLRVLDEKHLRADVELRQTARPAARRAAEMGIVSPQMWLVVLVRDHNVLPKMTDSLPAPCDGEGGDSEVAGQLLTLVYDELRRLAAFKLAQEAPGQTLQPTALVNEAWLRLVSSGAPKFQNRAHFFSVAAEAMRRILIDRARRKRAQRHGGEFDHVSLEGLDLAASSPDEQLLALHEALDKFTATHPMQAELVKLRYFAGLTIEETAELLSISVSTAKNYWTFSRAWLFQEVKK